MNHCPTCGRRHRPRRRTMPAPLPLFDWEPPPPKPRLRTGPLPRLVLLPDCRDADGEPRAGLMMPGHRLPIAFPSMAAAVAALHRMEAGR